MYALFVWHLARWSAGHSNLGEQPTKVCFFKCATSSSVECSVHSGIAVHRTDLWTLTILARSNTSPQQCSICCEGGFTEHGCVDRYEFFGRHESYGFIVYIRSQQVAVLACVCSDRTAACLCSAPIGWGGPRLPHKWSRRRDGVDGDWCDRTAVASCLQGAGIEREIKAEHAVEHCMFPDKKTFGSGRRGAACLGRVVAKSKTFWSWQSTKFADLSIENDVWLLIPMGSNWNCDLSPGSIYLLGPRRMRLLSDTWDGWDEDNIFDEK